MIKPTIDHILEFRQSCESFYRNVADCLVVPVVPMVNNGYLHTFNASFDGQHLRNWQTDSLLSPNVYTNFGTIQPCVRPEDTAGDSTSDKLHLSLFEICGYSIIETPAMKPEEMTQRTASEFMRFFVGYLGMDPAKLIVNYFGGATLREASKGTIKDDSYITPDNFSVNSWKKLGVDNLVSEHTNETFLLHIGRPYREHHSGYRNDIFMRVGKISYEIATLNFITHQTILETGSLIGIKPMEFGVREMAVGQERILAAKYGIANLYELPHIKPLLSETQKDFPRESTAIKVTDALRAVHYIVADGWDYNSIPGEKYRAHRQDLNQWMRILSDAVEYAGSAKLLGLLDLNADIQIWHPKLKESCEAVLRALSQYENRVRRNGSRFKSK